MKEVVYAMQLNIVVTRKYINV